MLGYYLEESLEYDPIRGPWWVLFHTSVLFNDSSKFPNFKKSYFPALVVVLPISYRIQLSVWQLNMSSSEVSHPKY